MKNTLGKAEAAAPGSACGQEAAPSAISASPSLLMPDDGSLRAELTPLLPYWDPSPLPSPQGLLSRGTFVIH